MGQIKYIGAMVLIMLFATAIIGYVINFADDNDTGIDLNDDDEFVTLKSDLETDMISFKDDTNSSIEAFDKSTIISGSETTTSGGQFKGGITSSTGSAKKIIKLSYQKIFGSGSEFKYFLITFMAFLGFVGLLYWWKTWAGKSPD
jgi:hypothetical protein